MRHLRLVALALALFAVAGTTFAGAATHSSSRLPRTFTRFLLRPNEPTTHVFARTPAFAWSPVQRRPLLPVRDRRRARRSRRTRSSGRTCRTSPGTTRAARPSRRSPSTRRCRGSRARRTRSTRMFARSPQTGRRGGAAVRLQHALAERSRSRWTSQPGLIRWTPVEGATRYQVCYPDTGTPLITTNTNVADEREYYTFHTRRLVDADHPLARPRGARRSSAQIPNGSAGRLLRPVEPGLHGDEPAVNAGPARAARSRSPTRSSTAEAVRARADARP